MNDEVLCNALRYEKWDEAADRIEALTAKVKLMDDLDVINGEKIEALTAKLAEAEAKLAKAMSIAKRVTSFEDTTEELAECGCARCKAHLKLRALLAEIEGSDAP
jgi:hypothetical protein